MTSLVSLQLESLQLIIFQGIMYTLVMHLFIHYLFQLLFLSHHLSYLEHFGDSTSHGDKTCFC